MLSIKLIKDYLSEVKENLKKRGDRDIKNIDTLLNNYKEQLKIKQELDKLRHQRNIASEEINKLKKQNKNISNKLKEIKEIPDKIKNLEEKYDKLKKQIDFLLFRIPNLLHKTVPFGKDETQNKIVRKWGKKPKFKFKPKNHWELGKDLDIIDMERGAKIAGASFYLFKGKLAQLERALINFMLDFHIKDNFTEVFPPILVNEKTMTGTGQLPKFEEDLYKTREGFYLIPTAEVPVTNIFANEVLDYKNLPKRFCAYTPCFRVEAGKHGTETRGIFRLHQFDKVEMVAITTPEQSYKELEFLRKRAEKLLEKLKIPYETIILCSGDTGFAAAKTYDIETWSPGLSKYLETSSCSNCEDFQARRMNTRFKNKKGKIEFVHTLNGSGLALPRLIIALLENYQQKDGSIKIPTVLQKYTGFKKITK